MIRCPTPLASREIKIKSIAHHHRRLTRMPALKRQMITIVGKDLKKLKSLYTADGKVKYFDTLENALATPENTKNNYYVPHNSISRNILRRNENLCVYNNLYTNVHLNIVLIRSQSCNLNVHQLVSR